MWAVPQPLTSAVCLSRHAGGSGRAWQQNSRLDWASSFFGATSQPLNSVICFAGAQVARDAFGSALSTERLKIGSITWALAREGLRGAPRSASLR